MDVRVGLERGLSTEELMAFELWCWRRLLSSLDCKKNQPVHPKGSRSQVFIQRTGVKAETLSPL